MRQIYELLSQEYLNTSNFVEIVMNDEKFDSFLTN